MAIVEFYYTKSKFTKQTKGELFGFTDFLCKFNFRYHGWSVLNDIETLVPTKTA